MINKVILIGNLGRDPEVRSTQSGTKVGTLSVATSEKVKNGQGEWVDHTEWHRCTVFGKTAENAARFIKKGSKVYIEGRLRTNKWKDKEGNDRYTTEILVDNLRFLDPASGGGRREESAGGGAREPDADAGSGWPSHSGNVGGDDDIPF